MEQNDRRTILINPAGHRQGACDDCGAPIVWVRNRRPAWVMMDRGFETVGYEPVTSEAGIQSTFLKVYCDQMHFVTCQARTQGKAA